MEACGAVTDTGDIQVLARTGLGKLPEACFLLLNVTDAAAARAWLAAVRPTSIADLEAGHIGEALQVAISAPGLWALGWQEDAITGFSPEFLKGMAGDPSRSKRLGDVGANAPENWVWGGTKTGAPHLFVALYAEAGGLAALRSRFDAELTGWTVTTVLDTRLHRDEPFGFADGVSQPTVDWKGERVPGTKADQDYTNLLCAGDVLLGYRDEYGLLGDRPVTIEADLGRNGSYLALRTLRQDVDTFWDWAREAAAPEDPMPLAEAVIGRRKDGKPLEGLPLIDIPGVEDKALNGFTYDRDQDGHVCPFGGHIRRANPRTGDLPGGRRGLIGTVLAMLGFTGTAQDDAIASARFHRVLRRGRGYGEPGGEQGLHFICLNASLVRQFEFVQGAWLVYPKFGGLTDEADPVTGNRLPFPADQPTDRFTRQRAVGPSTHYSGLPQFVTVMGGAYFFMPGLSALRAMASPIDLPVNPI